VGERAEHELPVERGMRFVSEIRSVKNAAMSERATAWLTLGGLTQKGWPPRFPLVHFPNLPLIAALVASVVGSVSHGTVQAHATAVFYLGLGVWAGDETLTGVNWFRRVLGIGFLVYLVARLGSALEA
jgi:hypothetical protein